MLPHDIEKFNQAVELANSGRKTEARSRLVELLRAYPNDANVLLWFAFTTDNRIQSQLALNKVRVLDPQNPSLPGAESWLAEQPQGERFGVQDKVAKYEFQPPAADGGHPPVTAEVAGPSSTSGRGLPLGKLVNALSGKLSGPRPKKS